jgi:hypothetical protein
MRSECGRAGARGAQELTSGQTRRRRGEDSRAAPAQEALGGAHGVVKDSRLLVSPGAGMSAAHVFVHVLPGLADLRTAFMSSTTVDTPFEGRALYLLARLALWLKAAGFAACGWPLSYLLLRHFGAAASSVVLFAIAIAPQLFGVDHGLHARHLRERSRFGGQQEPQRMRQ